MATFSDARAVYGLSALGTLTSTNASGSATVGIAQTQIRLDSADVAYSVRAIIASGDFVLATTTASTAGSTSFVAGTAQVETNTIVAASGATSSGTMTLVVTAAGMTGSPKNVAVALTTADHTTAALIATAARTALAADTAVAAMFTIGGTGADITLTRLPTSTFTVPGGTLNLYAANDATLNLAIPSGLGVTADATSTDTTAGIVSSGVKIYDGDGNDIEGEDLATISVVAGVLIQCTNGTSAYTSTGGEAGEIYGSSADSYVGTRLFTTNGATSLDFGTVTFDDATAPADISITVIGATA